MSDIIIIRHIERKSKSGIKVARFRNSIGFCEISITLPPNLGSTVISFNSKSHKDNSEQAALELAELLNEIACEPCLLPNHKTS